ncbi:hypothetical protein C5C42_16880 [Rathayibacter sp. AY1F7]|nr:hypothetical protein C5C54_17015 [Rathayibacter sp. AY1F2]PPH41116.1 hypothetical protein C5C42_16880 [Rathayibacter sp. AY1F7]
MSYCHHMSASSKPSIWRRIARLLRLGFVDVEAWTVSRAVFGVVFGAVFVIVGLVTQERWSIPFGIGLAIVSLAVFVDWRREREK